MRKGKREINYQTLGKISEIVSQARELEDVCSHVTAQLTDAMGIKGCAILLLDRKTNELEVGAAHGLSDRYLNKGPLSAAKSIADTLTDGPVAIYRATEDPRLQYSREAMIEGIESILSVPIVLRGKPLGALRLYTGEPWEFTMQDFTFVQAIAEIVGLVLDNIRVTHAYKTSIGVLKDLRPPIRYTRRTLYE